jgi:hypothetical protein
MVPKIEAMARVKKQNKANFTEAKNSQKLFLFFIVLRVLKDPQKDTLLKNAGLEFYQI